MEAALESIIMENLEHDLDYILYVFDHENIELDTRRFMTPFCGNPQDLWTQIVHIINRKNRHADIVDMMPLIDDFIEFLCVDMDNNVS
jgi:hypothetical protein